jgi:hypothetical protein
VRAQRMEGDFSTERTDFVGYRLHGSERPQSHCGPGGNQPINNAGLDWRWSLHNVSAIQTAPPKDRRMNTNGKPITDLQLRPTSLVHAFLCYDWCFCGNTVGSLGPCRDDVAGAIGTNRDGAGKKGRQLGKVLYANPSIALLVLAFLP